MMKRRYKLIAAYVVYFVTFIGLIALMMPTRLKYSISYSLYNRLNAAPPTLAGERPAQSASVKYVILTFDDGWDSQFEAYKKMQPLGLKGTLYICSGLVGKDNRLTIGNLNTMYRDGWDICNHTAHHVNLTKVESKRAYDEIYECSAWLFAHGFTRDLGYKHFAYPEGAYNEEIIQHLEKQGFRTARTTVGGSDTCTLLELGRASLHGMTRKNIRDFMFSDEKLIILSMHRITPDSTLELTELDLKESYFDEVINSIGESKRQVITLTEWYRLCGE